MQNPLIKKTFSAFALLAVLTLSACRPGSGEGKTEAADGEAAALVPVEVAIAAVKPMLASYTGTAALEPENQAQVVSKTSGVLLEILVEEGDRVHAGQVLARIDPERARLELARAEANLHRLENELRRSTDLFARKLVSSEAQDRARFDLDTQKAAYDIARLELDYTRIVAPITGVISERMVKVGNLIQLQQVMFRIDDFDPLLAVLNIPERELATMAAGLPAKMAVDALPGRVFDGRIARVSPVVEAGTGTFRATVEFRDAGATLKSGMFGRVSVVYDQRNDALVIPREALLETDDETAVFLLDPKPPAAEAKSADKSAGAKRSWWRKWFAKMAPAAAKKTTEVAAKPAGYARRVAVKLGYLSGTDAQVVAGIKAGDRVVTMGKNALREGAALQIVGGAAR